MKKPFINHRDQHNKYVNLVSTHPLKAYIKHPLNVNTTNKTIKKIYRRHCLELLMNKTKNIDEILKAYDEYKNIAILDGYKSKYRSKIRMLMQNKYMKNKNNVNSFKKHRNMYKKYVSNNTIQIDDNTMLRAVFDKELGQYVGRKFMGEIQDPYDQQKENIARYVLNQRYMSNNKNTRSIVQKYVNNNKGTLVMK